MSLFYTNSSPKVFRIRAAFYCGLIDAVILYGIWDKFSSYQFFSGIFEGVAAFSGLNMDTLPAEILMDSYNRTITSLKGMIALVATIHLFIYFSFIRGKRWAAHYMKTLAIVGMIAVTAYCVDIMIQGDHTKLVYFPFIGLYAYTFFGLRFFTNQLKQKKGLEKESARDSSN